jgi:membrane protein DedA with SNARE-associated domain
MWIALGLAIGTLVSEDAAVLGAATLARTGAVSPLVAVVAVALGVWLGDVALFLAGRWASRWPPLSRYVRRRWPRTELHALAARLENRAGWALALSRALPGTRAPLYVAAGIVGLRPSVFLACTAAAVALWTAVIVLGAQWLP